MLFASQLISRDELPWKRVLSQSCRWIEFCLFTLYFSFHCIRSLPSSGTILAQFGKEAKPLLSCASPLFRVASLESGLPDIPHRIAPCTFRKRTFPLLDNFPSFVTIYPHYIPTHLSDKCIFKTPFCIFHHCYPLPYPLHLLTAHLLPSRTPPRSPSLPHLNLSITIGRCSITMGWDGGRVRGCTLLDQCTLSSVRAVREWGKVEIERGRDRLVVSYRGARGEGFTFSIEKCRGYRTFVCSDFPIIYVFFYLKTRCTYLFSHHLGRCKQSFVDTRSLTAARNISEICWSAVWSRCTRNPIPIQWIYYFCYYCCYATISHSSLLIISLLSCLPSKKSSRHHCLRRWLHCRKGAEMRLVWVAARETTIYLKKMLKIIFFKNKYLISSVPNNKFRSAQKITVVHYYRQTVTSRPLFEMFRALFWTFLVCFRYFSCWISIDAAFSRYYLTLTAVDHCSSHLVARFIDWPLPGIPFMLVFAR